MEMIDKLKYIKESKDKIKESLINKNVEISDSDSFSSYSEKIDNMTLVSKPIGIGKVYCLGDFPIATSNYTTSRSGYQLIVSSDSFKPDDRSWEMHAKFITTENVPYSRVIFGATSDFFYAPSIEIQPSNNKIWVGLSKTGSKWEYEHIDDYVVKNNVWTEVIYEYDSNNSIYRLKVKEEGETEYTTLHEFTVSWTSYQLSDSMYGIGGISNALTHYFCRKAKIDLSETWIKIDGEYFLKI